MTWKVKACPERMLSLGMIGEGESRGQLANTGSPGKMAIKTVGVCMCVCSVFEISSVICCHMLLLLQACVYFSFTGITLLG